MQIDNQTGIYFLYQGKLCNKFLNLEPRFYDDLQFLTRHRFLAKVLSHRGKISAPENGSDIHNLACCDQLENLSLNPNLEKNFYYQEIVVRNKIRPLEKGCSLKSQCSASL